MVGERGGVFESNQRAKVKDVGRLTDLISDTQQLKKDSALLLENALTAKRSNREYCEE